MGYSFDGTTKVITLTAGTTTLDVQDLYSRWKDWIQADSENAKYLQAFSTVGGDPIDAGVGIYITMYFFLENGWKIKPQEANHKLTVSNGVLAVQGGGDPFNQTTGSYNVMVQYSQPIKTETVSVSSGSGLSAEEHNALIDVKNQTDQMIFTEAGRVDATAANMKDSAWELSAMPTTASNLEDKITWLFEYFRHKRVVTNTAETLYKDDGSTALGSATIEKTSTTYTKGAMV